MGKSHLRYNRGYSPRSIRRKTSRQTGQYLRYSKKNKRGENTWKSKIIFTLVALLILGLIYIIFFSPIFKIKEIRISGNQIISNEDISNSLNSSLEKRVLFFFEQNNIFLATSKKLKKIISDNFPRILLIEIDKNVFKKVINLKIIERKEIGIFCKIEVFNEENSGEEKTKEEKEIIKECYYIDNEGIIFEKAPQTSGTLILVIKDYSKKGTKVGDRAVGKELISKIINLRKYLSDKLSLKAIDFTIGPTTQDDLKVDTNENWYILFDYSIDIKEQVEALELILEKEIDNRENLEYVDLRIKNRVYYK